jgi:hypothetical protein
LGRVCLAATRRLAADVVLLRKDTGKQLGAERNDLLFDPLDSYLKRLLSYAHDVASGFDLRLHHSTVLWLFEVADSYILLADIILQRSRQKR